MSPRSARPASSLCRARGAAGQEHSIQPGLVGERNLGAHQEAGRRPLPDETSEAEVPEIAVGIEGPRIAETKRRLAGVSPEERVAGLASEQVFGVFPPEQRLAGLAPEQVLNAFPPEQRLLSLPDDALRALSDDDLRTLPADVQDAVRKGIGRPGK